MNAKVAESGLHCLTPQALNICAKIFVGYVCVDLLSSEALYIHCEMTYIRVGNNVFEHWHYALPVLYGLYNANAIQARKLQIS